MSDIETTSVKEADRLAKGVLEGDRRSIARLLRAIDDGRDVAEHALRELFVHTGKAHIVGITGTPGAGKSTLTDKLVAQWRKQGKEVGVLAIDPTSPFSGGAVLGDRVRMQQHALDKGVFIRSLATRGHLGGLSRSTFDSTKVLDAAGFDVVVVETVGVGQDEVDIAQLAHTTVLVSVPGLGDDVQAIKAGVLEIGDIFVVNKADREGADRTVRDLRMMLDLRHLGGAAANSNRLSSPDWDPPILRCVALRDEGVEELAQTIDRHFHGLDTSGAKERRQAARAQMELTLRLQSRLLRRAMQELEKKHGPIADLSLEIARRQLDPYGLVEELLKELLPE